MSLSKIFFSLICGIICSLCLFFIYHRQEQAENPFYNLKTLAYTTSGKELISKDFFEEALGLSIENPQNLLLFSLEEAKNKLLDYPFIESISLEKIAPDTLFIECSLKKPLLELADFNQVAIDHEGSFFPTFYFYTPKNLPKVFLGLGSRPLNFKNHTLKLDPTELKLILSILKQAPAVKMIDLSRLNAESLGQEEIILTFGDEIKRYVRLPCQSWEKALQKLKKIPNHYQEIDLRHRRIALVK